MAGLNLDRVTAERLARVGELWGIVRYFHTVSSGRSGDWDGAVSGAAERDALDTDSACCSVSLR